MTTLLVTRPEAQAAELSALLRGRGFDVVEVPTVEIDASSTAGDLDALIETLPSADWLVLTSANGADALVARLGLAGRRLPPSLRVAAVGPATAAALERGGIGVEHVPEEHLTVAIATGLGDVAGRRVVLARADAATPGLRDALIERGATVREVVAYRTVEGPAASRSLLERALRSPLDGLTFTSGSTVRGLLRLAGIVDRGRVATKPAFCIGPVTAEVAARSGLHVAAVAPVHTASGLADAIETHFAREAA